MTENAEGRKSFVQGFRDDFKALSTKQLIAIIAAIAIALVLEVLGIGAICIGFLIVAVALYMIPHMLGVMSVRVKAVIGIAFVVLAMLVGTFAYGGIAQDYQSLMDSDTDSIRNIDVVYDGADGGYYIEYDVNPSVLEVGDSWDVLVRYGTVSLISFGLIGTPGDLKDIRAEKSDLTALADGWQHGRMKLDGVSEGKFYWMALAVEKIDGDNKEVKSSLSFTYDSGLTSGDEISMCAKGAGYTVGLTALMFFLILGFSTMMRRSAEKTRRKMESEGRLYPQGYGRCKSCGATVLPGEVVCRKCGEYIEVPEELKPKKADYFTCSECGAEVPSDATVCPKCGAKFDEAEETEVEHPDGTVDVSTETVPCPHCGEQIPANADWCPKCGKKIKE